MVSSTSLRATAMLSTRVTQLIAAVQLISSCCCKLPVEVPRLELNDGHEIPAIALGTWLGNNSQGRITPSSDEVTKAVEWAISAGYRHVDTASIYQTEGQVGAGVRRAVERGTVKREDLYITTKLWNDQHARSSVPEAARRSLAALGVDYVDLYLIHWPVGQFANQSFDLTDYVDTWRGMMDAKAQGLTRSIGLSNFNEQMMERIRNEGLEIPAVLQVEMNLNLQQASLLSYCRRHNVTVMGYSPFGALFPHKAAGAPPPRADDVTLLDVAHKHNKTVPQIALRYLVELGVIPIPKSLTKSRIEENVDIFDFELTAEDKDKLRAFDRGYRTISVDKWRDHPYFPFEKN